MRCPKSVSVTFIVMTAALLVPVVGIGQGKINPKTGELITPAAKGERKQTLLRVGDQAPNFTLIDTKKTKEVTLSAYQGKKPVVLIFGSYT